VTYDSAEREAVGSAERCATVNMRLQFNFDVQMTDLTTTTSSSTDIPLVQPELPVPPPSESRQETTQNRVTQISSLLSALEEAANESGLAPLPVDKPDSPTRQHDNKLVQARLGLASSLFMALQQKHAQSAAHSLRVALGSSSWSVYAGLDDETRDTAEVAALMHDIGKIGVPDNILLKTNRLTTEEKAIFYQHAARGLEILKGCCGDDRVLEAVRYVGFWFDGQHTSLLARGKEIPLESRMISIVNAFDSLTIDHVYRPAMSRERALNELFESAGTQFDPELVKQFADMLSDRQDALSGEVAGRWLKRLANESSSLPWEEPFNMAARVVSKPLLTSASQPRSLFEQKLIDAMYDGVVFVDAQTKICLWSKGTERLTGVSGGAATGRFFAPSLLDMCNHANHRVADDACPVAKAILTNTQLRQRMHVMGRQGSHVAVDLHAIPVHSSDGTVQGATVLLHNAQPEASPEEKCEALYAEVTKDPLTKVANRAEFDRMQALFIEAHQQACKPCSLIIVDIDHFKSINDTYGHQAGDSAIITLANLLSSMCRSGDLVARYGGEEFAVLCADCSNADGARRAEQLRRQLSETQHPCLGNKRITASFGVTELQSGDTPETMLRRADRALLMAKEQGRNQVVQLGNGMDKEEPKRKWWKIIPLRSKPVVQTNLVTAVPIDVAIEKLRGFVSDHKAKIVCTREDSVELEVSSETMTYDRRKGDRHVTFRVDLKFTEARVERSNNLGFAVGDYLQTQIALKIRPRRLKKRRKSDMGDRARLIKQSIKAYLMAKEGADMANESVGATSGSETTIQ